MLEQALLSHQKTEATMSGAWNGKGCIYVIKAEFNSKKEILYNLNLDLTSELVVL